MRITEQGYLVLLSVAEQPGRRVRPQQMHLL